MESIAMNINGDDNNNHEKSLDVYGHSENEKL